VRRKDSIPAYQIASVVDDLALGVNQIVRGEDLLTSTAAQLFLAAEAPLTAFSQIRWLHHPLLKGPAGQKLSKSQGAPALQAFREQGGTPRRVVQLAAQWLGLADAAPTHLNDLLAAFEKLPKTFDSITSGEQD
jgi:glutamyl-tRNA synthetase